MRGTLIERHNRLRKTSRGFVGAEEAGSLAIFVLHKQVLLSQQPKIKGNAAASQLHDKGNSC